MAVSTVIQIFSFGSVNDLKSEVDTLKGEVKDLKEKTQLHNFEESAQEVEHHSDLMDIVNQNKDDFDRLMGYLDKTDIISYRAIDDLTYAAAMMKAFNYYMENYEKTNYKTVEVHREYTGEACFYFLLEDKRPELPTSRIKLYFGSDGKFMKRKTR